MYNYLGLKLEHDTQQATCIIFKTHLAFHLLWFLNTLDNVLIFLVMEVTEAAICAPLAHHPPAPPGPLIIALQ